MCNSTGDTEEHIGKEVLFNEIFGYVSYGLVLSFASDVWPGFTWIGE